MRNVKKIGPSSILMPFLRFLRHTTGGSAGILLVMNGDIMGASGILSNTLLYPMEALRKPSNHWRYAYLASFCLSVNIFVNYLAPPAFMADDRSMADDVPIASKTAYLIGGFLVGLGTKLGNGCTTGHGICGIARFSKRSILATCTFTGVSMLTTYITSPLRSWAAATNFLRASALPNMSPISSGLVMAASVFAAMVTPALSSKNRAEMIKKHGTSIVATEDRKVLGASISGAMFAAGLAISGMAKTTKVHDFLCLSGFSNGTYDPTLITVMGSGILSSWLAYQFVDGWSLTMPKQKTLSCPAGLGEGACFSVPTNKTIDLQLLAGAATFGAGWGLTGICPGPAIFASASGNLNATLFWVPAFLLGSWIGIKAKEILFAPKKTKSV